MAISENGVETFVVAFVDMAGLGFGFRSSPHNNGAESGIVPSVNLFESQISAERKPSKIAIVPEASATSDRC